MLQGARHVHMAALNAAAKDSGIEIEIHELRKATDLRECSTPCTCISRRRINDHAANW